MGLRIIWKGKKNGWDGDGPRDEWGEMSVQDLCLHPRQDLEHREGRRPGEPALEAEYVSAEHACLRDASSPPALSLTSDLRPQQRLTKRDISFHLLPLPWVQPTSLCKPHSLA